MKKILGVCVAIMLFASSSVMAAGYQGNTRVNTRYNKNYNSKWYYTYWWNSNSSDKNQSNSGNNTAADTENKEENSSYTLSDFEKRVVDLVNEERSKNGLSKLTVNLSLSKIAREKSKDMYTNNYFSHTSPTYGSPFEMMKQFGISYRTAGENIEKGQRTPDSVVNAWMNSEGHRKNILNSSFTQIGVGYYNGYWTQMFIGK